MADWGLRIFIKSILYLFMIGVFLGSMGFETYSFSAGLENRDQDLELTSGQIQTLKELKSQFRRELAQIRKKIMIKGIELKTLTHEEYQAEKGEELKREIQSLMLQARERSLFYQKGAFMVFTTEQQKKIPAESNLGFHCGGWFRRGGRWGAGTGRGGHEHAPSQ